MLLPLLGYIRTAYMNALVFKSCLQHDLRLYVFGELHLHLPLLGFSKHPYHIP